MTMISVAPSPRVQRFVTTLVKQCGQEREFAFDIMSFDYEEVRSALEVEGYAVRQDAMSTRVVFATRRAA